MEYSDNNKEYYLYEYNYFDGEDFITFNIVELDFDKNYIIVAVTNRGKISVITYDLQYDDGYYFEFGMTYEKINLDEFEEVYETDTNEY